MQLTSVHPEPTHGQVSKYPVLQGPAHDHALGARCVSKPSGRMGGYDADSPLDKLCNGLASNTKMARSRLTGLQRIESAEDEACRRVVLLAGALHSLRHHGGGTLLTYSIECLERQ